MPLWHLPTLAGAGALRSNVEDLLVFLAANTGPPESRLERVMRTTHEVREHISGEIDIGLNWHVRKVGDERIVTHGGGTAGSITFGGFDPDKGVSAVLLSNSSQSIGDTGLRLMSHHSRKKCLTRWCSGAAAGSSRRILDPILLGVHF